MQLSASIGAVVTGGPSGLGAAVARARTGTTRSFPSQSFDQIIQINLIGSFRCIAKSAAGMLDLPTTPEGERGVVINTASIAAQDGQIGQAAYSASKAAIVGMTLPIARDLMDERIRINTILPGNFNTPLLQALPEKVKADLSAAVPFPKRLGEPDEFAALVEFIAGRGYLNGECIRLDGAIRMPPRRDFRNCGVRGMANVTIVERP